MAVNDPKRTILPKTLLRSMLRFGPIVLATGQAQSRRRDPRAAGGRGGEQGTGNVIGDF
jgi:hypothetical protein